jgi:tetratricopeptide (TPR) repeat protein
MIASLALEHRFEQVLAEFLLAEERGERPDPSELLRANPDLETPLGEFFRDRSRFDRLVPTVRDRGAPPPPEPPPVSHFGNYAALEQVGQGGRGSVYRVSDPELNRPLAVKVLRHELREEPDAVRRFLEEAQVMGQLQHPGIVPVHAVGQLADGRPYFVMKLVQGRTLGQLLAARPAPAHDLPRFLVIFEQVCQAVAYAHSRGVIHRDLKPANVMVGAFAEVQVMDWGLAKVLEADGACQGHPHREPGALAPSGRDTVRTVRTEATGLSSADGLVVGTFPYIAPEQAQGRVEELDSRADVFGLGAILCTVLTGLPPYAGGSAGELHRRAAAGDLADAFARLDRCGADAELIALAKDCLAPERERRPRDAGAVAERLATYLAEVQERLRRAEVEKATAQARAEEARATARAERRARRLTVGLAVAVLAVVVALTVGGLWLQRQQAEEARQAEALRRDVGAALGQAIRLRQGAHFEESRELLEQAQKRLGTDGPSDLREQVDQALADTGLARRLDAARHRAMTEVELVTIGLAGAEKEYAAAFKNAGLGHEKEYAAALKEAGLGQEGETPEVVAARVRTSGMRAEVVAALDDWASISEDGPRRAWLLAVARAADPDPERDRLRQPKLWRDRAALARLAGEARVAELSPQLGAALGRALVASGGDPIPLMRKAQAQHPGDYWLNFGLAWSLSRAKKLDEAIGYYRAALALRPTAAVHQNLGNALRAKGRLDAAASHYKAALRINPKFDAARNNLGGILYTKGKLDAAISQFQEALRINRKNAIAHYHLGLALHSKGRLDAAVSHYKAALRINPKLAIAHANLGKILGKKGQLDGAISHYKAALRIDSENAKVHHILGNALYAKGRLDDAIGHYQGALRIDRKYAHAHTDLGLALYAKGKLDEAVAHLKEALRLDPKDFRAHNNLGMALFAKGCLDEAVAHYKEALRINPKEGSHFNLGMALHTKGRLDAAIEHYKKALHIDPKDAQAHINLGMALYAKGKLDEAVDHYKEALRLDPKDILAHNNLGMALFAKGCLDDAVAHYKEALRINPKYAIAHYNLGLALHKKGRLDEAIGHYQQALRAALALRRQAGVHHSLGTALHTKGRLDAAIKHYKKALHIDPKDAQAHTDLGLALYAKGKLDEAVDHYKEALRLDPKNFLAHINLGMALYAKGKLDEAVAHYKEALRINPKYAIAHYNLGLVLYVKGWLDAAVGHYKEALRINPKLALAHLNLGVVLFDIGRSDKAVGHYKDALRIDPKNAQVHGALGEALLALGSFIEARAATRRCLDLLPRRHPTWTTEMQQLRRCERMILLQGRLPDIVSGKEKPAGVAEGFEFGWLCQVTKHYAASVRLYTDALAADPKQIAHRYNAACSAALAATALKPNDKEQPRLRRQALDWLRADLAMWKRKAGTANPMGRAQVQRALWAWQNNLGLASVRDRAGLAKLPDTERAAWQKLWAEVEALRKRARETKDRAAAIGTDPRQQ